MYLPSVVASWSARFALRSQHVSSLVSVRRLCSNANHCFINPFFKQDIFSPCVDKLIS
jgi:hypothetical protein